jgi:hypothetical protein
MVTAHSEFAKAIVQRCIAMRQVSHESSTLSFKVLDAQDVSTPRAAAALLEARRHTATLSPPHWWSTHHQSWTRWQLLCNNAIKTSAATVVFPADSAVAPDALRGVALGLHGIAFASPPSLTQATAM